MNADPDYQCIMEPNPNPVIAIQSETVTFEYERQPNGEYKPVSFLSPRTGEWVAVGVPMPNLTEAEVVHELDTMPLRQAFDLVRSALAGCTRVANVSAIAPTGLLTTEELIEWWRQHDDRTASVSELGVDNLHNPEGRADRKRRQKRMGQLFVKYGVTG